MVVFDNNVLGISNIRRARGLGSECSGLGGLIMESFHGLQEEGGLGFRGVFAPLLLRPSDKSFRMSKDASLLCKRRMEDKSKTAQA